MKEAAAAFGWPVDIEVGLIGSCTNSSYEDLSRAASVVSKALGVNLMPKAEFKITPGSEQVRMIAERDGFLEIFRQAGGEIFANACGPCIGQWDRQGSEKNPVNTVIHSFNRNFAKRTDGNPNTNAFVASPEIVTALTFAGKLTFNPLTDTLKNSEGKDVMLPEPSGLDLPPGGFDRIESGYQKPDPAGAAEVFIDPASDRLQVLQPFEEWDGNDYERLPLLIKVRGKCTTDHISMAGVWLKYRGHLENISNNYMIGALNSFNDKTNSVINQLSGKFDTVPAVARAYKAAGIGSVVVGEENFGEGSSREHAAMEPRYLNVRVVLVKSFARIHETNLKKQGMLPLTFSEKSDYDKFRENDRVSVKGLKEFAPGRQLVVELHHDDGTVEAIKVNHTFSQSQIEWFRAGGALNLIRKA
jgi:aconitate hydratase